MNKNPQKRYREIGEDGRMVAIVRIILYFFTKEENVHTNLNRK